MTNLRHCSIAGAFMFWIESNSAVRHPYYCNKATLGHNPPQLPLFEAAAIAKKQGAS
jgi:hypothetical protein